MREEDIKVPLRRRKTREDWSIYKYEEEIEKCREKIERLEKRIEKLSEEMA